MTHVDRPRIPLIDSARTLALGAMVVFHFVFDLEMFGWLPPGTAISAPWRGLAIATAASFLFLAGVSLWLAHGSGIRWRAFWRRFGILVGAAALVSLGTYLAFPDAFVFFGILHSIALGSLLGLAALRLPVVVIVALAVAVFYAPAVATSEAFNTPLLLWTGLQTITPATVDYEPIFPWFAALLSGIAAAKAAGALGVWDRLSTRTPSKASRVFGRPGQHSLIIYLVHQPILIAVVAAGSYLAR